VPDGGSHLRLELHPKQLDLRDSPATEILYGGAAGGGKSFLLRALAILYAWAFPGLQVYFFRRISDDLTKNHMEGSKGFRALLAGWVEEGQVEIVETEIRFKFNGSRIFLCHCHDEKDRFKYQGAEMHVLLIDELTHFTEVIYRFLRSRVRMVGMNMPEAIKDRFPRIIAASNPGNVGHQWVKQAFIDGHRPSEVWRAPDEEGGMLRQFLPAKLTDNPSLLLDDPGYRSKLRGLGSAALVKAMEEGDWNAIEGAFFDCWDTHRHVVKPFEIPQHWMRFRSFDWGSAKPFSVGWWASVTEPYTTEEGITLPRGCMVRYREWYGASAPNVGLKLHAPDVARGILLRQDTGGQGKKPEAELISYSVGDPSIFKQDGGPSIAEEMGRNHVAFRPADNTRIAGWQQLRKRLVGDEDGNPMLVCFDTCANSIRTIPSLMHDDVKPEDVNTDSEDHAGDDWRYACMSRPWSRDLPAKPQPIRTELPTLGELTEAHVRSVTSRSRRIG
jgi:hypothetical protein